MRRIPSLSALRAFDAAARRLHFADAANELGLTPGAVSRQIQQLETNLGVKLFDRDSRTVKLTEMGKTYAADIASALDSLAFASDRIRAGSQHKPLRICAYPTFALRWLIPRWREFFDLHPDIDLQLTTSLSQVDPQRDGFDAVVRLTFPHQFEKNAIVLAPLEIFPVCSPRQTPKIRSPLDLRGQTLIHSSSRPNDWPRWLRATGLDKSASFKHGPTFEKSQPVLPGGARRRRRRHGRRLPGGGGLKGTPPDQTSIVYLQKQAFLLYDFCRNTDARSACGDLARFPGWPKRDAGQDNADRKETVNKCRSNFTR